MLSVSGVHKRYGVHPVLHGAGLEVPDGAVVALLGQSGCGKTTLLRAIAGFGPADAGRIVLDGRMLDGDGASVPAERRHIGYVPQEGSLFPHLTVAGNVGFGLSRAARRGARVDEMLALTGLAGLEGRYPHELSGGQQQRTALARALAPGPRLVLLDEPFNALDLTLRRTVCADVVALLRRTGATAILVTHDPAEAYAAADLLAVMRGGQVAQVGSPAEVYRAPADAGIARLTGSCVLLPARVEEDRAVTVLGPLLIAAGTAGQAMLRAEQVVLDSAGQGVPGNVTATAFRGDHHLLTVEAAGHVFTVQSTALVPPGATVHLAANGPCVLLPDSPTAPPRPE